MDQTLDLKSMIRRAYAGESFALDRDQVSLHDLTQIAVALQTDASLTIRNARTMTPIERASIATVGKGRVIFA